MPAPLETPISHAAAHNHSALTTVLVLNHSNTNNNSIRVPSNKTKANTRIKANINKIRDNTNRTKVNINKTKDNINRMANMLKMDSINKTVNIKIKVNIRKASIRSKANTKGNTPGTTD